MGHAQSNDRAGETTVIGLIKSPHEEIVERVDSAIRVLTEIALTHDLLVFEALRPLQSERIRQLDRVLLMSLRCLANSHDATSENCLDCLCQRWRADWIHDFILLLAGNVIESVHASDPDGWDLTRRYAEEIENMVLLKRRKNQKDRDDLK